MRDWQQIFSGDISWRTRDAHIESAIRRVLADIAPEEKLTTSELVIRLSPTDVAYRRKLGQRLAKMAPYLNTLARHDGAELMWMGRKVRRWNWYGQKQENSQ